MTWLIKAVQDWVQMHARRSGTSGGAAVVAINMLLGVVLVLAPACGMLAILERLSSRSGDALHLTAAGAGALAILLAMLYLASQGVAAYAKLMCASRYMSWPWLLALSLGTFGGATVFLVGLQDALSQLHAGAGNDNGKFLIGCAIWMWAVGNAIAPIGAELIERWKAWIDLRVSL